MAPEGNMTLPPQTILIRRLGGAHRSRMGMLEAYCVGDHGELGKNLLPGRQLTDVSSAKHVIAGMLPVKEWRIEE
jgi:hypothetical protein